jgi:peptide/nickel transport system ATP-binding protein
VLRELKPGHKVACHWAEQIRSGEIQPHEVKPILIEEDGGLSPDIPLVGPASVTEALNP